MFRSVNKVRAIIIDSNNEVIVTNYAGIYMFPGGKVDNETNLEALKRELEEELGISFNNNQIEEFIDTEKYIFNYPVRDSAIKEDRNIKTKFYIIRGDFEIKSDKQKLTESEKSNQFYVKKYSVTDLKQLVLNNEANNPRNQYLKEEVLEVLEVLEKIAYIVSQYNNFINTVSTDGREIISKFNPKKYLNGQIKEECEHELLSTSGISENYWCTRYECLICGKIIEVHYGKYISLGNRHVVKTFGCLGHHEEIAINLLNLIAKIYAKEESIDIVSIFNSISDSFYRQFSYSLDKPTSTSKQLTKTK